MKKELRDVAIIGGGPAGMACGIYCQREEFRTILFESELLGGQALKISLIENYPGFSEPISGPKLMQKFQDQMERFGVEVIGEEVLEIKTQRQVFSLKTSLGTYFSRSVVIATGVKEKKLGIRGERELLGKGVSYCATCDGPLMKGKDVIIVGGGDTALSSALFISRFARKVFILHRRAKFRASKTLQRRLADLSNIELVLNSKPIEILGSDYVEGIRILSTLDGKEKEISLDGVFISIGHLPNTDFLKDFLELSQEGEVIVDIEAKASVQGIFAAGDVRKGSCRQVATAVGDGVQAAISLRRYLEETK
jgi:thioredoxin reductase (NADPH)